MKNSTFSSTGAPVAGIRCFVSGWGKNDFANTGQYQAIMRAIDVPLIDYDTCQKQLRATRLGANFVLDAISFTCAGGESSKGFYSKLIVLLA